MIDESLEEMKETLKTNGITVTSAEVKNMTYPVVAQSNVEDIETDTREDLILMHEHNNNEHSNTNNRIQEV
jgi:hypothetical protein